MVSEELSIVLLCREMKWGYDTYVIQPDWFIEILKITNNVDAHHSQVAARRAKKRG